MKNLTRKIYENERWNFDEKLKKRCINRVATEVITRDDIKIILVKLLMKWVLRKELSQGIIYKLQYIWVINDDWNINEWFYTYRTMNQGMFR